jgi:hypothetical protein
VLLSCCVHQSSVAKEFLLDLLLAVALGHTFLSSFKLLLCGNHFVGRHGRGEEIVQGFGGEARRKETARKTKV